MTETTTPPADSRSRLVAIEQWIREPGGDGPLAGAGVLVANPPFTLADETDAILPRGAAGRVPFG